MIFYILCFIVGIIFYYILKDDISTYTGIHLDKNIFFPIFLIIVLISGLMIVQYIHSSETIIRNSNEQQSIALNWCFLEDGAKCNELTQEINNSIDRTKPYTAFIGVSLISSMQRNMFSYFFGGIFISWLLIFILSVVSVNARKD